MTPRAQLLTLDSIKLVEMQTQLMNQLIAKKNTSDQVDLGLSVRNLPGSGEEEKFDLLSPRMSN